MKKLSIINYQLSILCSVLCALLTACGKPDPILPGVRHNVFAARGVEVLNKEVKLNQQSAPGLRRGDGNQQSECLYTQDQSNTVWDGDRKIFTGFATENSVATEHKPVCAGGFVYAGLTTGELVKINPRNRAISWVADIYAANNMLGGAAVADIVAPIIVNGADVYAGSLADAFCKIRVTDGAKKWCLDIGVGTPFTIVGDYAFVVGTTNTLYAINTDDGAVYWATPVKRQSAPKYNDGIITVAREQFDVSNGNLIK